MKTAAIIFLIIFASPAFAEEIVLNVPFKSQVPPGDWSHTRNCGPTAALMMAGYYLNFTPITDDIKAIDDWLYDNEIIYPQAGIDKYNGNNTNLNDIQYLLSDYFDLGNIKKVYAGQLKQEYVKEQIRRGNPVIVVARLNMQASGIGHFMLVIGFDDTGVIVHDPGHSAANGGQAKHYSYSQFLASWASWGYATVHANTFTTWHPNGSMIKTHHDPRVYVLLDEAKHWIVNWEVFLSHGFDANKIIEVNQQELDCYPDSWDVDWKPYREVFRADNDIWYYMIEKLNEEDEGCMSYQFASGLAAQSWGYEIEDMPVYSAAAAETKKYLCNQGGILYLRDSTLIRPEPALTNWGYGEGAVFVISDGLARPFINHQVFQQMAYNPQNIWTVNQSELLLSIIGFGEMITVDDLTKCSGSAEGSGPECIDGDSINSYLGPIETYDIGQCQAQIQICENGSWVVAQEEILPSEEIDDGLDNDCDGLCDEGFDQYPDPPREDEECVDGELKNIYDDDIETMYEGLCQPEIQECEYGFWNIVQAQVVPSIEIPDDLDNDCDGLTDEGFEVSENEDPDPYFSNENPQTPDGNMWVVKSCGDHCIAFCGNYLQIEPAAAVVVGNLPNTGWQYANGIQVSRHEDNYYHLFLPDEAAGLYRVSYMAAPGIWAQYGDDLFDNVGPFRYCGYDEFGYTCWIQFEIMPDGMIVSKGN